jgi:hypothetical protein
MTTERLPTEGEQRPKVVGVLDAPTVYFDGVSNQGNNAGVLNIVLVAAKHIPGEGGNLTPVLMVVADLRCSIQGALSLKQAIDNALLLAMPTQGSNN